MTPKPLDERMTELEKTVADLDSRTDRLEHQSTQIRRDQREMRKHMRALQDIVDEVRSAVTGLPSQVKKQLDEQTSDLKLEIAQAETRNADRIATVARQWPAGAIILATLLGSFIVAVAVDAVLAAFHQPHIG